MKRYFFYKYIFVRITECVGGSYGVNCSLQCVGHCKDGANCNHVNGVCDGRCDTGWTGKLCDKSTCCLPELLYHVV